MLYAGISIFAAVIIFLLIARINILLEYNREGLNDNLVLSVFALKGLLKYKFEIPLIDLEKSGIKFQKLTQKGKVEKKAQGEKGFAKFQKIFDQIKDIKNFYNANRSKICDIKEYLKERLVCREFRLEIELGTDDACYTGILSGIAWSAAGVIVSFIENNYSLLKKSVRVKPKFNENYFSIDLYCIFNIKIVNIIVVGIKILPGILKGKSVSKTNKTIGGGVCG